MTYVCQSAGKGESLVSSKGEELPRRGRHDINSRKKEQHGNDCCQDRSSCPRLCGIKNNLDIWLSSRSAKDGFNVSEGRHNSDSHHKSHNIVGDSCSHHGSW